MKKEIKYDSYQIKQIGGKEILFLQAKDIRTTHLLGNTNGNLYYLADGISCTSSACSNSDGCIPKSKRSCSSCFGDCSKTVSAVSEEVE